MRARIVGTGSYLPARVVTNEEISRTAEGSDPAWIEEKLGIVTRRVAAPDEQTSDLAKLAAERALEAAGMAPNQLDGILCAIGTGDVLTPATAGYIQRKLGIANKGFAIDLKLACAGTIGGMMMARGLIETGLARNLLVVGTHVISRTGLNWKDRRVAPIFGDGAGAAILTAEPEDGRGILESTLHTDGTLTDIVGQFAGGTIRPLTPEIVANGEHLLQMDGRAVWDCAVREVPAAIRTVLAKADKTVDDVDFVVAHQANKRLLAQILAEVGIPFAKTHTNVERYGNTVAASALIALDESVRAGRIRAGDLIVMCAIGAGMSWGAHLIRW